MRFDLAETFALLTYLMNPMHDQCSSINKTLNYICSLCKAIALREGQNSYRFYKKSSSVFQTNVLWVWNDP